MKKFLSIKTIILLLAVIIIVISSIAMYKYDSKIFLSFTLGDALALLTAVFIGYYLVEHNNAERELGKEALKTIENIQNGIMKRDYLHINQKENRSIVLTNNRWCSNQIFILERISIRIKRIEKYANKVRDTYNEYEKFVSVNMDQSEEYFNEPERYEKQRKNMEIIEFNLQQMMLALYDVPDIENKK